MVMLVGVQSNQTPRALDIARPLRALGIQVAIGGFHMSGVISMINGDDPALREAQAMGLSVFAGEAEGRLDEVLRDAYAGTLKPLYNYMNDLPGIEGAPLPLLARERVKRTGGGDHELRRRPRLPVPVLVLHHHQRAGAQVAAAHARRHRADRPQQPARRACSASSSPTTISPATRTGRRSSTG